MKLVLVSLIFSIVPESIVGQSLTDLIKRHSDLSEVLDLVRRIPYLSASLPYRQVTLFAPTNDAIREFKDSRNIDNYTVLYHLSNSAKKTSEFEDVLSSELPDNPPIWVTKKSDSEIYLNNAKVDPKKRDFKVKNQMGMDQVLHVIDRVLDPPMPSDPDASNLFNPNAGKFLEFSSSYNITGVHRITEFAKRVAALDKMGMFRNTGRHTFFIPVDSAFENIQINTVDPKVIDGHVIPDHVLFLRAVEIGRKFKTAAFSSSLPVFVSFGQEEVNGKPQWSVKSDTRSADGDAFHRKGVVHTSVVRGNIPVKNGVVHLISKPLVVIDSTVYQTIIGRKNIDDDSEYDSKETSPTYEFYQLLKNHASDQIRSLLVNPGKEGVTVFVPSNEALRSPSINILKSNATLLEEILKLHIVLKTITSDNITDEGNGVRTGDTSKKLFFNFVDNGDHRRLYVEGGGVNATIVQPDIGATNGVIHIIDRVLGSADQTIYQKLRTDPMLQTTFQLSSQDSYNLQFNDTNKRFTLFAPSNTAWEKLYFEAPSEHKKLMMGSFGYHVRRIIQRHTIVNRVYKIDQLRDLSENGTHYPIQAIHGMLKVTHKDQANWEEEKKFRKNSYKAIIHERFPTGAHDYTVSWQYRRANVIRPNIECVNGIIHIIDAVLMTPSDVTVSSAPITGSFTIPSFMLILVSALIGFYHLE